VLAQGCDEIQGNLEALPMSADDCEVWLRRRGASGARSGR
jgi:EAL domain-containing protein (putative c-di-GMP-specific phosphodiesterase class I)